MTIAAASDVVTRQDDPPSNFPRSGTVILAITTLLAAAVTGAVFALWVELNNSIYFAAVEIGNTPLYPVNHQAYGLVIGGSEVLFGSLAVTFGWLATVAHRRPLRSPGHVTLLVMGSILIAASVPVFIQFVTLGIVPLLVGVVLLVALLQQNRSPQSRSR